MTEINAKKHISRWESSLTSSVGTTVELNGKNNQKIKQRWSNQQDYTGCNTTVQLTLINQGNRKGKQQWWNWVGEVCSVNQSDQSYWLYLYWLMQYILLILSIVSVVSILAFSIAVQCDWKIIQMNQQTMGLPFGVKKGDFLRLMEFTGIWKYFKRSVWEINKINLMVMTINSPWNKIFTLCKLWGGNIFLGNKVVTIVIYHLASTCTFSMTAYPYSSPTETPIISTPPCLPRMQNKTHQSFVVKTGLVWITILSCTYKRRKMIW